MKLTLTIPGEPVAKGRPRVMKSGITFTPAKTKNYETLVKELFIIKYLDHRPLEGPLRCFIDAYMQIPKSASKKKLEAMQKGYIRPTKRPDVDNLCKSITDALNGIAYRDDSQIVSCHINKRYDLMPRVEIEIEEVSEI